MTPEKNRIHDVWLFGAAFGIWMSVAIYAVAIHVFDCEVRVYTVFTYLACP